jgi:alpha-N-arabinofuranosidase
MRPVHLSAARPSRDIFITLIILSMARITIAADTDAPPLAAQLVIHADHPAGTINRNIYGQFAEHLGTGIYGGVWVGPDSPIPNTRGIRNDVVAALKNIAVPVVRWLGGCFADEYHWMDGIGPREKRPSMTNSHWGGVKESNAFGTHEFFDFCEQLGAEPYVCGNLGSGTVQEMAQWVEYITSDADSPMANLRRANGREKPWKLQYFGVGNESWGCGGNMRPEHYADEFRRYDVFVKNWSGNKVLRFACGPNGDNYDWTDTLMNIAGKNMNGLSLHNYTLPTGNWQHKGPATAFPPEQWDSTMLHMMAMEELITKHSAIMDKYDPQRKVGLVIDEWGGWYDVEKGTNPGFLHQQSSLRDAIIAGVHLNIFQHHIDRVVMTNIAQMVNVLQAMILTDGPKMVLTPTYYVYEMYTVHQGATGLPVDLTAPSFKAGTGEVPMLSASASRDADGKIHVSIVNMDRQHAADVTTTLSGASSKQVTGRIITADAMDAHNTFDQPENVKPAAFTAFEAKGDQLTLHMPAKSVVMVEMQ